MWVRWALTLACCRGYIVRPALCFYVCIFLRMFLPMCAYVCVTSVSVLPSVGSLVKRARKCLTDRAVVTIAPRDIIEETLMYIANYQKWQNSSYTRSSGSTYVSSRTIKDYAGWYCISRKNATKREREKPSISSLLFSVAPVKSPWLYIYWYFKKWI